MEKTQTAVRMSKVQAVALYADGNREAERGLQIGEIPVLGSKELMRHISNKIKRDKKHTCASHFISEIQPMNLSNEIGDGRQSVNSSTGKRGLRLHPYPGPRWNMITTLYEGKRYGKLA